SCSLGDWTMMSCIRKGLLAVLVLGTFVVDSPACWCPCVCICQPICWYPCWPCCPCWPPDTNPLKPLPEHPGQPTNGTQLYLHNGTYAQAFASIYIRYPDYIYREYDRVPVKPGTTVLANNKYFQGDHL